MTIFSKDTVLAYGLRALQEELGVAVPTSDPVHFVNQFYKFRNEPGADPRLQELIAFRPNSGGVFLIKKTVHMEDS